MEVRTFRAKEFHDALKAVKQDLGEDAVILSSRTISAKTLGTNSVVEIKATREKTKRSSGLAISSVVNTDPVRSCVFKDFQKLLELNGLTRKNAQELMDWYQLGCFDHESIDLERLAEVLQQKLSFGYRFKGTQQISAFVGPTGVGKTTTIAKLTGKAILQHNLEVGIITIDTHRVGGAEQMCALASVFNVHAAVVATYEEFSAALNSFRNYDRIYIDTAGSGPNDQEKLQEIGHYLSLCPTCDTFLLIPASGNTHDYKRIMQAFGRFNPRGIGVTKTDETSYFGPCLNTLLDAQKHVEFFGTGQQVPDDIESASALKALQLITSATH